MTAMLVLVLAYTILGGMVSVVITDYIQFIILSIGIIAISVFVLGWGNIVETVKSIHGEPGLRSPARGRRVRPLIRRLDDLHGGHRFVCCLADFGHASLCC